MHGAGPAAVMQPLLSSAGRRRQYSFVWAVGALAVCAVVALVSVTEKQERRIEMVEDKSTFPLKKVQEIKSASGKPCWACPCCNGCEKSGAAKAAGCGGSTRQPVAARDTSSTDDKDPAFSPVQKKLVREMIDSALHEHGLNVYKKGNKLAWRKYPAVFGESEYNRTQTSADETEHHLYRKMGKSKEEDVWWGGKDWFERPTRYNDKSKVSDYEPWEDPSGIWQENPVDQDPWKFAESRHWDRNAPENKDVAWEDARGKMLQQGEMSHGDHKTWADVPNPQWGWQHQFANWDPDGDANQNLVFGKSSSQYEAPPWELSWVDPRLYGDDFIPEEDTRAKYAKPMNNQFADWVEPGEKNQELVFGTNHGSLRQRTATPIKDNWSLVMDSKADPEEVKKRLGLRGADVTMTYPSEGTPASHFFSEWDKVPTHKKHVVWEAGSEGVLSDEAVDAGEEGAAADGEEEAETEYTPDQKRGFINKE